MPADPASTDLLRRTVLVGAGLAITAERSLAAPVEPRAQRPKPGDRLVFADGDRKGRPVAPQDLPTGGPQTLVWPIAPDAGAPRDLARVNQVLLLRLDPATLDADTLARSADGVVAYAAMCSHAGCVVKLWEDRDSVLQCPCHNSRYDPRKGAAVVFGPAPRRLAALPVRIADGMLEVAGPFIGAVGPSTGL